MIKKTATLKKAEPAARQPVPPAKAAKTAKTANTRPASKRSVNSPAKTAKADGAGPASKRPARRIDRPVATIPSDSVEPRKPLINFPK